MQAVSKSSCLHDDDDAKAANYTKMGTVMPTMTEISDRGDGTTVTEMGTGMGMGMQGLLEKEEMAEWKQKKRICSERNI